MIYAEKDSYSKLTANDAGEGRMKEALGITGIKMEALDEAKQIEQITQFIESIDEIKLENWEKLTMKERADVLQRIENKTAEIMERSPLQVEVRQMPTGSRGEMNWYDGKIRINSSLISSDSISDLRQTITTLAHESRHAYQWSNLLVKRTEASDEKFESWRVNIKEVGYISASRMGYYRYYIQPVEVDARVFAENVAKKISFR